MQVQPTGIQPAPAPAPSARALATARPLRSPLPRSAAAGAVLVGLLALLAILADHLTPYSYDEIATARWQVPPVPPSAAHWLGTDALGRDLLTRLLHGARISLVVGMGGEALAVVLGVAAGGLAGWRGGWVEVVVMRGVELVLAFPMPLMVLAVAAAVPDPRILPVLGALPMPEVALLCVVLGGVGWAPIARVVRGQLLSVRRAPALEAARAVGAGETRLLLRHLLPSCLSPLLVAATVGVAGNVLAEAWLSFLGLGIRPPLPSWGAMVLEGQAQLTLNPRLCILPGLAICLAVLAFNLLGDGLRDRFDPRLPGRPLATEHAP